MKNTFLLSLFLLSCSFIYGQDTVKRSNQLSRQIFEQFNVLKSNKKLRQGEYYAIYSQKMVLAKGRYEAGKRVGQWQYFTATGKLIQTFDYDKYQFTFLDTAHRKGFQIHFLQDIAKTDTVTNPIVIGGNDYTIQPLITQMEIFQNVHGDFDEGMIAMKHVFSISADGTLLKHEVIATGNGKSKTYKIDDRDFDDGNKKFIPAMINHQPVACELSVQVNTSYSIRTSTTTTTTPGGFPSTRSTRTGY